MEHQCGVESLTDLDLLVEGKFIIIIISMLDKNGSLFVHFILGLFHPC
jgi:hypothetical protein